MFIWFTSTKLYYVLLWRIYLRRIHFKIAYIYAVTKGQMIIQWAKDYSVYTRGQYRAVVNGDYVENVVSPKSYSGIHQYLCGCWVQVGSDHKRSETIFKKRLQKAPYRLYGGGYTVSNDFNSDASLHEAIPNHENRVLSITQLNYHGIYTTLSKSLR